MEENIPSQVARRGNVCRVLNCIYGPTGQRGWDWDWDDSLKFYAQF